jgi:tetratricopeptide (TPR) repeat protein
MSTPQQRLAGLAPDLAHQATLIGNALQQGRLDEAERGAIAALARAPQHPEILRLFGMVALRRGRSQAAVEALRQALAQRPDDAMICNELGGAYERVRDYAQAREMFQRACALDPQLAACWYNLGRRLTADGDIGAAIPALQRTVDLQPHHVNARSKLADILRTQGRFAEATAQFRGILQANPRTGSAWWSLAMLKPMPLTAADISTMQSLLRQTDVAGHDRVAIQFALAMAYEHAGDFAAAFHAMQAGHGLASKGEPYQAAEFSSHLQDILDAFSPPPRPAEPQQGREVIFIASLPRSGSTLTEQILASHSQVEGTSELHDLGQVIMEECTRLQQPFTAWARSHTPTQWHALGQKYLARTQHWRQQRPMITDKMPANWMYVGAILAMLPQARVVICRRDPLETCLGCYRYIFMQHPYTHTLADLASHWRDFDRAVRYWQAAYPDRVRVQVYEDLVADADVQIGELLAFCGLPFEPQCLNFHATERSVNTPSAAQVREPLRRDTARAAKYGALLDPLREALDMPAWRADAAL